MKLAIAPIRLMTHRCPQIACRLTPIPRVPILAPSQLLSRLHIFRIRRHHRTRLRLRRRRHLRQHLRRLRRLRRQLRRPNRRRRPLPSY